MVIVQSTIHRHTHSSDEDLNTESPPSTNMIPSKTLPTVILTKCVGQPVDTLSTIKVNIQIIRLLLEDSPVLDVEWLVGLKSYIVIYKEIVDIIIMITF